MLVDYNYNLMFEDLVGNVGEKSIDYKDILIFLDFQDNIQEMLVD